MSKGEILRALVSERLTAAAEEIFSLVERTIAEYEEELRRSKEENQRKQQLLEEALRPEVHTQSSEAQIQTDGSNATGLFKEEDEGSDTCVIVKNELFDTEDNGWSELADSDVQLEMDALTDVYSPVQEAAQPPVAHQNPVADQRPLSPQSPEPELRLMSPTAAPQTIAADQCYVAPTTAPQPTALTGNVPLSNCDGMDKMKKVLGKRKRRKPRRVMAPAEEKNPLQHSKENNIKQKEVNSEQREAEERSPTSSPPEVKGYTTRKKDLAQTPAQSKCPKAKSKCLRASLEHVAQNMTFTREKGGNAEFRCTSCDRAFTRLHHLERHILIHTGERSFSCAVCDKSFRLKQHLISHMTIHKEERLFHCPVCPQKFKRKDNLGRHIMVHTGVRPYGCPQCDVRFSLKKNLVRHMIVHDRDVTYNCSVCNMEFSSPFYFKKHTKTHMKRK